MKHIRLLAWLWMAVGLLVAGYPGACLGFGDSNAKAMAMAGSFTALARGIDAVGWNPANLGLDGSSVATGAIDTTKAETADTTAHIPPRRPLGGPEYSIGLFSFGLIVENNSFSVADYNEQNGSFISTKDKNDLLDKIPGEGLTLNANVEARALSLAFPGPRGVHGAVSFGAFGRLHGVMPKDLIEFLMLGNDFGRTYRIGEIDGGTWAVGSASLTGAKAWMPPGWERHLDQFSVGLTVKYLRGLAFGEVTRSEGGFTTRDTGVDLSAKVITRRSQRGSGFGLDIGCAAVRDRLTISVGWINALGFLSWTDATSDSVVVMADSLYVTRLAEVEQFEEIVDNKRDANGDPIFNTETPIADFSSGFPGRLRLGVAYWVSSKLVVTGSWDQGFGNAFGESTTPRLSAGAQYLVTRWFPVRAGFSIGGRSGKTSSLGFGLGPLHLAFVSRGGLLPGISKGTALAVSLRIGG